MVQVVVNPCLGVVIMLLAMYAAMKFWPKFNGTLVPKQVGEMEVHPPKMEFFLGTQKLVACRCFSFCKGIFSGSMLIFRGVS